MRILKSEISVPQIEMPKYIIYFLAFLFTLHITPSSYLDSSFLEQFVGSNKVGYIYSIASLLTLTGFILVRRLLIKIGNYKTFLLFLIIEFLSLFILSTSYFFDNQFWAYVYIISYIISFVAKSIGFLSLDIFLEHFTKNKETGKVRGFYLTSINTAFIIGPLIAGFIITSVLEVWKIYLLSWIILIPVIIMAINYLKNFKDARYERSDLFKTSIQVFKNTDLRNVFFISFLLNFFYSWMIIYTPIFLTETIGFSLGQTATIISIGLIPFVLLQLPIGKIADELLGEKEILVVGFIITGISTLAMSILNSDSFLFWVGVLLLTRIGASLIEVMSETHLFKRIDDNSISVIGLFRAIRPMSYIISPIIASMFLVYYEINNLFLILGIITIFGLFFSLSIRDSK